MNRRLFHFDSAFRLVGHVLGCLALLLPLGQGTLLPVSLTAPQPLDEEESRGPVETTKIAVGAVHGQPDRRIRPLPPQVVKNHRDCTRPHSTARLSPMRSDIPHAYDLHNGVGGNLIV